MQQLQELRQKIGELDSELLAIFAKRRQLSQQVAENKYAHNRNIRDHEQEKRLLEVLTQQGLKIGIPENTTLSLFHNIIEDSVRSQYDYFLKQANRYRKSIDIALLGEAHSYSHMAAQNHFTNTVQSLNTTFCSSFMDVFKQVADGHVELGLVPIENTTSGNIIEVFDLLIEHDLKIVGEEKLKVKHCLIGTHNATLESIKDVYSHPQAIAQCKNFFSRNPKINSHYRNSTSSALSMVKEYQNPSIAAIASEMAAQKSGLKIIDYGINNYQENYTRFLLISRTDIQVPKTVPAKTSILLHTHQETGSLLECLHVLKQHKVNMSKLESRPIPTKPWQEMFYIDFDGNISHANIQKVLEKLAAVTTHLQVLGCYPKHDVIATHLNSDSINYKL
ncbi:MAG: prephenate dehydratase [Kangiellaceae bacterium]|nr:prephenate dehydratase [Kangiellaceae bacterium]